MLPANSSTYTHLVTDIRHPGNKCAYTCFWAFEALVLCSFRAALFLISKRSNIPVYCSFSDKVSSVCARLSNVYDVCILLRRSPWMVQLMI